MTKRRRIYGPRGSVFLQKAKSGVWDRIIVERQLDQAAPSSSFTDDFETNAAAPLTSRNGWIKSPGTNNRFQVASGQLRSHFYPADEALVHETGSTTHSIEWSVDNTDGEIRVAFIRFEDIGNSFGLRLPYTFGNSLQLFKRISGGYSFLGNFGTPSPGLHTYKVEAINVGSNVEFFVYLDGVAQLNSGSFEDRYTTTIAGNPAGTKAGFENSAEFNELARSVTLTNLGAASGASEGSLTATEAQDSAAIVAGLTFAGTLAATETIDSAALAATTASAGSLTAIDAQDNAALAAVAGNLGTLAATETGDVAALTAVIVSGGTLAATETGDGATLSAASLSAGTLAATDTQDAAESSASAAFSGTLFATEAVDDAALAGEVSDVPVSGALVAIEAQDGAGIAAALLFDGSFAAIEPFEDGAALTGTVGTSGTLGATEIIDTATFAATLAASGLIAASDGQDQAALVALAASTGAMAGTETSDLAGLSATAAMSGALAVADAADSAVLAGELGGAPRIEGALAATESGDVAVMAGISGTGETEIPLAASIGGYFRPAAPPGTLAAIDGTLRVTETPDHAAFTAEVSDPVVAAILAARDDPDRCFIAATIAAVGELRVIEAADTAVAQGDVFTRRSAEWLRADEEQFLMLLAA